MRLADVMTEDLATASPRMAADEALQSMRARHIHHLVVQDHGAVVGVVSERDLGGRGPTALKGRTIVEFMNEKPITMRPNDTVRQAANRMRGRTIGCVPIVDEGRLLGIVTVSDLLELLGRGAIPATRAGTREAVRTRGRREERPSRQRGRP